MKKKITKIYEIFFLFILSLTPFLWLKSNQLVLGHDSGFRLNLFNHLYNIFYSWNSVRNLGEDWSYFKGFLITQFPEAFFTALAHSLWWGQELTFVFWFFLMIFSMYICINSIFPEKKFWFLRIFSSLFYAYNFFILQAWFIVERSKFSVYAALPLGFLIIFNTFKKKYSLFKGTVLFSLVFFFLNGGGNPPVYGGLLVSYVILLLVLAFFEYRSSGVFALFKSIRMGFLFLLGAAVINSYWIVPQVYLAITSYSSRLSSIGGVNAILGWEGIISKNASLLNLFRLQGIPDWYDNPLHPYAMTFLNNPLLIFMSFLPLGIIIVGLAYFRNVKESVYVKQFVAAIFLVFMVGLIFAGGTHPPFGDLYAFLITRVPGFAIFRSSYYKFSPALFFSAAILTAYFLQHIFLRFTKSKKKYFFSCMIAILLLLAYNYPYFVSNFFVFNSPFTTKVTLPAYTKDMFNYINSKVDSSEKILLLPELMKSIPADSYTWGYWSLDVLPRISIGNSTIASDNDIPSIDALYEAIKNNDEKLFMEIARTTGISKVLWRGDVLLNDHMTTSSDLSSEDKNLSGFKYVKLQKSFGPWKLYSIESPQNVLFTTVSQVNLLDAKNTDAYAAARVIDDTQIRNVIYASDTSSKEIPEGLVGNNISLFTNECSSCDTDSIENLKSSLLMPTVKFLPWSRFYFLVTYKENVELKSAQKSPAARIDVDLSDANKRLVEIWRMGYKDFNSNAEFYTGKNAIRYEQSIDDALSNLSGLSVAQKNDYIVKMIAYMQFQRQYIQFFNQNNTLKASINNLLSYMDGKIALLQEQGWISSANNDRKSFVNITHDGLYAAKLKDTVGKSFTLLIDGHPQGEDNIPLKEGIHAIEIQYSDLENVLESKNGVNLTGGLQFNKSHPLSYDIADFSYQNNYYIQFSYLINQSNEKAVFTVSQNNSEGKYKGSLHVPFIIPLTADGKMHTVSYHYKPYIGTSSMSLAFSTPQDDAVIDINQFSIEKDANPIIYFVEQKSVGNIPQPEVTYKKIDPTQYIVKIKNATNPFILLFNQTFKPGWKATIISSDATTNVSENSHIEINGYENGWYLIKKGNYSVRIEYMPQRYFYVGLAITIVTLIGAIIYIVKKNNIWSKK